MVPHLPRTARGPEHGTARGAAKWAWPDTSTVLTAGTTKAQAGRPGAHRASGPSSWHSPLSPESLPAVAAPGVPDSQQQDVLASMTLELP